MRASLRTSIIAVVFLSASASAAIADVGSLSVDAGGGVALVRTPAVGAQGAPAQSALTPVLWLDTRYGVSNLLELTGSVFLETGSNFTTTNASVALDTGTFTNTTLQFRAKRFGALAGVRLVQGNLWRLLFGGELGVSLTSYSGSRVFDAGGRDIGQAPSDTTAPALILAPSVGVAWVGDRLSVALVPRAELLLGSNATWALVFPLTIGWDTYIR